MTRSIRNFVLAAIALIALAILPATALAASNSINTTNAKNGNISVYYVAKSKQQLRVSIKTETNEQFVVYKSGSRAVINLPVNNGEVTITLYEQVSGKTYKAIETATCNASGTQSNNSALQLQSSNTTAPSVQIQSANAYETAAPKANNAPKASTMQAVSAPVTQSYTQSVSYDVPAEYAQYVRSSGEIGFSYGDTLSTKAAELTAGKGSTEAKVMAIYSYIIKNVSYDWDFYNAVRSGRITSYTPNANTTIASRKGVCYDVASLMAAMCRSVGIPAKLVKGNSSVAGGYHAWNSVYDFESNRWVSLDATMNLGGSATSSYRTIGGGYSAQSAV